MGYESLSTVVVLAIVVILMLIWLPRRTIKGMKRVIEHREDRFSPSLHLVDADSGTRFSDETVAAAKGVLMQSTEAHKGATSEERIAEIRALRHAAVRRRRAIAVSLLTITVVVLVCAFALHFSPLFALIPAALLAAVLALGVRASKQAVVWERKVARYHAKVKKRAAAERKRAQAEQAERARLRAQELAEARKTIVGLEAIPENNVVNFARLYKAYKSYVGENHIGALCSRCWPDFFTEFGTPVCSVLSLLNANGVSASCESDAYGALSMFIGSDLTSRSCFFGDPVSMNEKEGTITFWHCGMAACDLARKDTGAQVGVHPNRKIGPVMDFGCEACEHVTIFRVGRKPDGSFRFFIAEGSALDKPKQFNGTSVVVKTVESAKDVVYGTVKGGWEPHFVVVYGQVANELEKLGNMLGVEVCKF